MKYYPAEHSPLSPDRAFVVQLRAETDITRARVVGRVEHVVSAHATQFQSVEELLVFIDRMLTRGETAE